MRTRLTVPDAVAGLLVALPVAVPLAGIFLPLPGFFAQAAAARWIAAVLVPLSLILGWGRWRALMRRPLGAAAAAYLCVLVSAAAVAEDPARAFLGDSLRDEGVLQAVAWAAVFFAASVSLGAPGRLRLFLRVNTIAALGFGIGAVAHATVTWLLSDDGTFGYRISWPFFNPLFFGNAMALSAAAAAWLSRVESGRMRRLSAVAGALLLVMALASGTRSVVLGMAGAAIVAVVLRLCARSAWPLRLHARRWRAVLAATGTGVAAAIALAVSSPAFFGRLLAVSLTERSAFNRFLVWLRDVPAIVERPLLGWGPESHLMVFYRWFTADFYSRTPEIFDRAHNAAVEAAVTTGLLGVAAGGALVGALFWTVHRRIRTDAANRTAWLSAGALFGYAVFSDLVGFQTVFTLAMLVPLAGAVLAADAPDASVRRMPRSVLAAAAALAALYAIGALALPLRAALLAVRAYDRYPENLPGAIADYAAATAVPTFMDDHFGKFFAHQVEQEIVTRQVRDEVQVLDAGRLAEAVLKRAEAVHPWDPSLPLSRARLYEQLGKLDPGYHDQSAPILEAVVARYPERFEGRQLLALVYLREERHDEALAQYDAMLRMNPDIPVLHQLHAIALARAGRREEAMAALDEAVRRSPSSVDRVERIRERIRAGESPDPGLPEPPVATYVDGEGVVEP